MIMTFGEAVIFASLMIIAIAIMKTGDRIVEAIRARALHDMNQAAEKNGEEL